MTVGIALHEKLLEAFAYEDFHTEQACMSLEPAAQPILEAIEASNAGLVLQLLIEDTTLLVDQTNCQCIYGLDVEYFWHMHEGRPVCLKMIWEAFPTGMREALSREVFKQLVSGTVHGTKLHQLRRIRSFLHPLTCNMWFLDPFNERYQRHELV